MAKAFFFLIRSLSQHEFSFILKAFPLTQLCTKIIFKRIWAHCTITLSLSRIKTNWSNIMKNCMWCRYRILGKGHIFCILKSLFTWGRWSSMYETMHKYATMRLCATMQLWAPMCNYTTMHLCINMHGYMRSFQETSPEFLWFPWWGWARWPPALRFESFACFALVAWLPPV